MVGTSIVCSKQIVASMSVLTLLFIRFSIATFVLLPLHWFTPARSISIKQHTLSLKPIDWGFIFLQAIFAGVLFNFLMMKGLQTTDANVAGIITSALPAIIAMMSFIFLKETVSFKKILCILFATAGLMVLAYSKFYGASANHALTGDLFILLSLLPEAGYYILCKLHPTRSPIFLTSTLFNGINALILIPFILYLNTHHPIFSSLQAWDWFILAVLGITSGLFYIFWFMGCEKVDGMLVSLSTAVMPVATVILAWIILNEHLTLLQFSGMFLVIASIVIYAKR